MGSPSRRELDAICAPICSDWSGNVLQCPSLLSPRVCPPDRRPALRTLTSVFCRHYQSPVPAPQSHLFLKAHPNKSQEAMCKLRMTTTTFEVATKFGPNHFLYDTPMNKPRSLLGSEMCDGWQEAKASLRKLWVLQSVKMKLRRSLLGGGDVNMWMTNDESLPIT